MYYLLGSLGRWDLPPTTLLPFSQILLTFSQGISMPKAQLGLYEACDTSVTFDALEAGVTFFKSK